MFSMIAGYNFQRWLNRLSRLGKFSGCVLALSTVAVIAVLDYLTGYEVRLAILYLLPIALATWTGGRGLGMLASLAAALCWSISFSTNQIYSREIYYYWEAGVLALTFVIFILLIDGLHNALSRADVRLFTVLDGLSAAVSAVDEATGRLLYANRRFIELFGEPTAGRDTRAPGLAGTPPGSSATESGFRSREVRDEQRGRWYMLQSGAISWVDGRNVQLDVLVDITEQKHAAALRHQHQEMLHDAGRFSVLAEIASMLGHEINQPLMAIAAYNDAGLLLLRQQPADIGEAVASLEKSRDQAIRASRIIERARGFLKRREASAGTANINEVTRRAVNALDVELESGDIHLELQLAADMPDSEFDEVLVEQVVVNLTRNALDAVRSVQGHRRIVIATEGGTPGAMTVSITDNGIGIPPQAQEKLFTPFFTTKPHGIGLGLSICRSVVEAHAGRIWNEPVASGGTRFCFTLPFRGVAR